ncbi:hypothetical protein [Alicyclobacillus macrosporangiidus]|uniref:hypothetical protein n=1 Tax=Alicyclobacillus macrosporangiidus TaxID=392015 RepID=UPI0004984356|nr:hypothetical protein [Alicyclobacillus macrosporangiidus]
MKASQTPVVPSVIEKTMKDVIKRGSCPAAAIRRALMMQRDMVETGADVQVWIDAMAVLMSWQKARRQGHRAMMTLTPEDQAAGLERR